MTLTNAYCTLAKVREELGVVDDDDDTRLEAAISAASRQIDAHCGRRFWQDETVVTREYRADGHTNMLEVDDISTTTGLVVRVDDDDDGVFEVTLAITTDFILEPLNAADMVPVWPYTEILLVDGLYSTFPWWSSQRPGVQVEAKFGWPAVPDDVEQACVIQSRNLYKAASAAYTGFQLSAETGIVMRTPGLDFVAKSLLEPYVKVRVA